MYDEPVRPILDIYAPKTFSNERWSRDFQASWYKIYTWLDFSLDDSCGFCYACYKYGNGEFQFRNWKKTEKLKKHAKSEDDKLSMVKWMGRRAQLRKDIDAKYDGFVA